MVEIRLGDTVQDKYTGLKGIALTKMIFINGCVQYGVIPKWDSKNPTLIESEIFIDSQSLKLIKKGEAWTNPKRDAEMLKALEDDEPTGGPTRILRRRG